MTIERRPRFGVDFRRGLAGSLAGALTNGLLHPLDTAKTIRQANPKQFPGTFRTIGRIWRTNGIHGLYGGLGTAMVGAMPSSFIFFGMAAPGSTHCCIHSRLHPTSDQLAHPRRPRPARHI